MHVGMPTSRRRARYWKSRVRRMPSRCSLWSSKSSKNGSIEMNFGAAGAGHAEEDQAPSPAEESRKPFIVRFRPSLDRPFGVSLSFRTEAEPEPRDVVEALKTLIREIEADLD